ncbi:MAG: peroxiredoxin family protein [Acidimicrobiia bacterium]|nr:peroxiredoxin family protein [Acidimicrobiia bacterium]MDH4307431.1 peroxiredoxin family protein [Acidimicrobiia bacterium]MDH5293638.1 peroxiredoxin family protein [Acidimicrobiia bacterium]
MDIDFTLTDQAGNPWTLSQRRGIAHLLVFLRGDW